MTIILTLRKERHELWDSASKDFKMKISFHEFLSQISWHEPLVYVLDIILNEWLMLINLKYFQYFSVKGYYISNIQAIHCKWFRIFSKSKEILNCWCFNGFPVNEKKKKKKKTIKSSHSLKGTKIHVGKF